jgi:hypothetical protein
MTKIDENLEVMAQIKMNVDFYDAYLNSLSERDPEFEPDRDEHENETEETEDSHCGFGSAVSGLTLSRQLPENFDSRLRAFLRQEFEITINDQELIQVAHLSSINFKLIYAFRSVNLNACISNTNLKMIFPRGET